MNKAQLVNRKVAEKTSYKQEDVESCGFCNRTYLALRRSNTNDVFTLVHLYNNNGIKEVRGIGKKGYAEIDRYVHEHF